MSYIKIKSSRHIDRNALISNAFFAALSLTPAYRDIQAFDCAIALLTHLGFFGIVAAGLIETVFACQLNALRGASRPDVGLDRVLSCRSWTSGTTEPREVRGLGPRG